MIRVKAEDSFLYHYIQVMTGNTVEVDEADIDKLIAAGKISQQYKQTPKTEKAPKETKRQYVEAPDRAEIISTWDQDEKPDKFLNLPKHRKHQKY